MQPDIAARRLLRVLGGGRCFVVGDAGVPLVPALLAYGVDATCHASSADLVAAGNNAMPGRFTQGEPDDFVHGRTDLANVVFINSLDAFGVARLRAVMGYCRPEIRSLLIVADDEAKHAFGDAMPRDRTWWEGRCLEAGFRRHPRSHLLRQAKQLGGMGRGVIILCEPEPVDAVANPPAFQAEAAAPVRDFLRLPGLEAEAFAARYAWVTRWIKLGDTVLDAACGMGAGSWLLTRLTKASRIIGVVASVDAVAYARRAFPSPRLEFAQGDLRQLLDDLPANSLDCIIAYDVIGQPAEAGGILQSLRRALAPAGRLILGVSRTGGTRAPSGASMPAGADKSWETLREALRPWLLVDVAASQVIASIGDRTSTAYSIPHIETFDPAGLGPAPPEPGGPDDWLLAVAIKPVTDTPQPRFHHRFWVHGSPVHINSNDFPAMLDNPWLQRGLLDGGMRPANPVPLRAFCEEILAQSGSKDQAAALTVLGYRLAEDGSLSSRRLADHLARIDDWFGRHAHQADEAQITRWLVSLSFLGGILTLRMGDLAAAILWFERCLALDAAVFGPLLFTKTVEAAHRLGWIYYGQANLPEAQRAWTFGVTEASRALALRRDAGAHPLANQLPFVFDEYGAICDMATRCALALSQITIDPDSLDLSPVLSRPRERCAELEAELAALRNQLAEVKAANTCSQAKTTASPNVLKRVARYLIHRQSAT